MTMYAINKSGLKPRAPTNNSFTVSQNDIEKQITNRLHYYKTLKDKLDAQATKASSIALRKQWLDKQKKVNYQSEYDRIRSQIEHNVVKEASVDNLKRRRNEIKNFNIASINNMSSNERADIIRKIGAESNVHLPKKGKLEGLGAKLFDNIAD